jgi:hypothetical protein
MDADSPPDFVAFVAGSSSHDFQGASEQLGRRFHIVDLWRFLGSLRIDFQPGEVVLYSDLISFGALASAGCIYYHPDSWDLFSFSPLTGDTSHCFAKRQLLAVSGFLESWLESSAAVVNRPSVSRKASNKLVQLEMLAQCYPEKLIAASLEPSDSCLHLGRVIKHVSESRMVTDVLSNYARVLDLDSVSVLSESKSLPILSQELIKQQSEFRAYIFGQETIIFEFYRGNSSASTVDVHLIPDAFAGAQEFSAPPDVIRNLRQAFVSFGLEYGAVDFFIVDGLLKILEINPLPSWGWLPCRLRERVDEIVVKFSEGHFEFTKSPRQ